MPHLAIDASTTNGQLAIDYPSDHVSTMVNRQETCLENYFPLLILERAYE